MDHSNSTGAEPEVHSFSDQERGAEARYKFWGALNPLVFPDELWLLFNLCSGTH